VDSSGGTILAWASMGLQAHRLGAKGPHARSWRLAFEGLEDTLENLV
jgi:hypothetical protein